MIMQVIHEEAAKLTLDELNPGDVFTVVGDEDDPGNVVAYMVVDGGLVGVPAEVPAVGIRLGAIETFDPATMVRPYPNARVILGAPFSDATDIED